MRRISRFKKRTWVLLGVVAAVAAMASVGAYAYFSASGSGSGTAAVGSASNIVLSSDAVTGLYPGNAATPLTVHVSNPGGGNQYVDQITGAVATQGGCLGSWFTVAPINYAQNLAPGAGPDASSSVSLDESNSNQNACQGLTMTINWTSN